MKVNKARTKVETLAKDSESVGGIDPKLENAKVKEDNIKNGEAIHSLFRHLGNGIENVYSGIMNTRKGKHGRNMPRRKGHTNTAKFSKRAKLKRRKQR